MAWVTQNCSLATGRRSSKLVAAASFFLCYFPWDLHPPGQSGHCTLFLVLNACFAYCLCLGSGHKLQKDRKKLLGSFGTENSAQIQASGAATTTRRPLEARKQRGCLWCAAACVCHTDKAGHLVGSQMFAECLSTQYTLFWVNPIST